MVQQFINEKIAIISDQPRQTGIGVYALELYDVLRSLFREVILIYVGGWPDEYEHYYEPSYFARTRKLARIPFIINENYRKLNELDLEDYIKHFVGATYPVQHHNKSCFTVHDVVLDLNFLSDARSMGGVGIVKNISRLVYTELNITHLKRISNKNDAIISISKVTAKALKEKTGRDSSVIYHWINEEKFRIREKESAKSVLGLSERENYLLTVGNERKLKRLDLQKNVADHLPDGWKLLKIGYPISSNNVINLGKVEENRYPLYFNASDAYIHLSDTEGFGWPVIEAIGSGLPVIARINEINSELISDAGLYLRDDKLCEDLLNYLNLLKNPSKLSDILVRLHKVSQRYTREAAIANYALFYKKFLNSQIIKN